MGRSDAVTVVRQVLARMQALDARLLVTYEPGWETRGNGYAANYEGGLVHHTASPSSPTNPFPTQRILRDGRTDLAGPLCNFAGPYCTADAPRIHVVAAYPANHAGASGGRSMGPLPVTTLFNPRVLGLEIDYAGLVPMSDGQFHVALLWARAVADVLAGGNTEYIRGHFETSITGKWDPGYAEGRSLDMAVFRTLARQLTVQEDDLLADERMALFQIRDALGANGALNTPAADSVQGRIYAWLRPIERYDYGADGEPKLGPDGQPIIVRTSLRQEVANLSLAVATLPGAAELAPELAPLLVSSIRTLSDEDVARVARAVADEQARRLGEQAAA